MPRKQMPQIDIGLHMGARAGANDTPYPEAEAEFCAKYAEATPDMLRQFKRGYRVGFINERIQYIQAVMHDLDRKELDTLTGDIEALAQKWGYEVE